MSACGRTRSHAASSRRRKAFRRLTRTVFSDNFVTSELGIVAGLHDSATRIPCQESSSVPPLGGTAVEGRTPSPETNHDGSRKRSQLGQMISLRSDNSAFLHRPLK